MTRGLGPPSTTCVRLLCVGLALVALTGGARAEGPWDLRVGVIVVADASAPRGWLASTQTISNNLGGAVLEAGMTPELLTPSQADACDSAACVRDAAIHAGTRWFLIGRLHVTDDRTEVTIGLYDRTQVVPLEGIRFECRESQQMAALVTLNARRLLKRIQPAFPAEPSSNVGTSAHDARQAQAASRLKKRKSVGEAFALELLLPSAGFIYTESLWEAALEQAMLVVGVVLFVQDLELCALGQCGGRDEVSALGLLLIIGSRVFGLVGAPMNAAAYNARLDAQSGSGAKRRAPPAGDRAPVSLGPRVPRYTLSLPSFTF